MNSVRTKQVGFLVGQLMQLLMEDASFNEGYQEGIRDDAAVATVDLDTELLNILGKGSDGPLANKITAIKRCREMTNDGLKEAKDYVEDLMRSNGMM